MTQRADIAALRLRTEATGELVAAQVQSIASWPKVALKDVHSYETQIDTENRHVTYILKMKPKKSIQSFQMIKIIEESVWALAGDTWKTTFKIGSKALYVGSRRREIHERNIDFGQGRGGFDPERS